MLARQRQEVILEETRRTGAVRVSELVSRLGVSDMTIRRDLDALAGRGLVEKVYGGATSVRLPGFDGSAAGESSRGHRTRLQSIAATAARRVRPGSAIGMSGSAATRALARALSHVENLTVVTNSLRVADILGGTPRQDRDVVLTGGIRTQSDALVGPVAVQTLRGLHLDFVFVGVHGMAEGPGFTVPDLSEREADRALIEAGRRLVVLADHTRFNAVSLATVATLAEADVLVSDDGLRDQARRVLSAHVGELVLAPGPIGSDE
ncbi:DeoR/GlpR family DNA-binding transcription regulator [Saccharomonospora saliphila]|uniref:DeoR/GlpR family DNA-binding transcription regulator n=1 Tax=Saccharomonospora saliphila TaxID=369829 RepID=UPI0003A92044|nr:DeoR/GlpR family DNA-binding transcription regulator [Saccharomonospora saliphila]